MKRLAHFLTTGAVLCALLFCVAYGKDLFAQDAALVTEPDLDQVNKISLDLKGMDVVEAIKMLAAKGKMNVVVGAGVKGRVTIFLNKVYIMDAFDIMLVSSDLAYERRGDIIYVMPQQEYEMKYGARFADRRTVKVFLLKYAKAADAVKALGQMKTKIGKVIADEGSNSVIVVDSPDSVAQMEEAVARMDFPTVTHIYELKYATAADIKTKLTERLTAAIGAIQIDERTNKVAVTDSEWKMTQIDAIVTAFDTKPQQVLIEAKIIQITLDDKFKMGVDWESFLNKLNKEISVKSMFELVPKNMLNPGLQVTLGALGTASDYAMMIQMIQTMGDTNLLSSPRITALNNQEAKILVGTSQPYATSSVTQNTGTATTATSLTFIDVGVKLYVTPTINNEGFITMKIRPEVSSVTGSYPYYTSGSATPTTVPIVSTTQAETSVTVKDGTTIIIGGLVKDERKGSVDQVPFLGDIPVIGAIFKRTDDNVVKQEIVVFLTPHIITGETDYLEDPRTEPIGEDKFTMSEQPAFSRRNKKEMDPGFFKNSRTEKGKQKAVREKKKQRVEMDKAMAKSTDGEYYYAIKATIIGNICVPPGKKGKLLKGNIKVSFSVSSNGDLAQGPTIVESSNSDLDPIVIAAVKNSAPFPAFPSSMGKEARKFGVSVELE